jgi:hypothetical protein
LVPCQEAHTPGVPLWVTFPYDSSVGDGQPEMLAKVVRVGLWRNGNGSKSTGEGCNERVVAVHFALAPRAESTGNGHAKERQRRDGPRRPLALPIRVRPEHIPWFEEAMTLDVSAHGLRFVSNREYREGERLLVCFEPAALAPWPTASESLVRVVRIDGLPENASLAVTIVREA